MGATACYAANALSYIPFLLVVMWILPRQTLRSSGHLDRRHPFAGISQILSDDRLRGALLIVLTNSVLCGPLITFTSVLVRQVFVSSAGHFSLAMAAFGVGGLLGAFGLLWVNDQADRGGLSAGAAVLFAVVLLGAAINPWFGLLPVLLAVAGIAMTVSNISANTLVQERIPEQLRGQAVSLFMLCMRGGIALGALLTGVSVSLIGIRHALLVNGLVAFGLQSVFAWLWWQSRRLDVAGR